MECILERKDIEDLRPTSILPQTPYWGKIKHIQGYRPAGFELNISKDLLKPGCKDFQHITDDMLVLIRSINSNQCFAYVPYGPRIEPEQENQGIMLEEISETIRPHLPSGCIFIRYDLRWENQWAREQEFYDEDGNWTGPPESQIQEFRVNYKTNQWNLRKSPEDVLPKNTFFLDLRHTEEELLCNMRYNTRYNIRKAFRQGIEVREYGEEHIPEWYELFTETAIRQNMPLQEEAYFAALLKKQDNTHNGVHVKLLMARHRNKTLASMFLVMSNKRGAYLYGASSRDHRHLMASYALQWESIRISKEFGCTEYDMFGSAPNLEIPIHCTVFMFTKKDLAVIFSIEWDAGIIPMIRKPIRCSYLQNSENHSGSNSTLDYI